MKHLKLLNNMMLLSVSFLLFFKGSAFSETLYYSAQAKSLEVSRRDEMILEFESAPLTVACQPKDALEFLLLDDGDPLLLYTSQNRKEGQDYEERELRAYKEERLSRFLKLKPSKAAPQALCAFSLENGESFKVNFKLLNDFHKPYVKLRSLYKEAKKSREFSSKLDALSLFKSLFLEGEPRAFTNITGEQNSLSHKTDKASYRLHYAGTDKEKYTAWIFEGVAKKTLKNETLSLKRLGVLYYSAYQKKDLRKFQSIKEKESFRLSLLSRHDVLLSEIKELLL
jgi:hypothetical protein